MHNKCTSFMRSRQKSHLPFLLYFFVFSALHFSLFRASVDFFPPKKLKMMINLNLPTTVSLIVISEFQ